MKVCCPKKNNKRKKKKKAHNIFLDQPKQITERTPPFVLHTVRFQKYVSQNFTDIFSSFPFVVF